MTDPSLSDRDLEQLALEHRDLVHADKPNAHCPECWPAE